MFETKKPLIVVEFQIWIFGKYLQRKEKWLVHEKYSAEPKSTDEVTYRIH